LKAVGALRLVGVEMVITGVRPALARSLVDIGVDMSGVVLRSTLQSGVAFALQWR
jgi:rsbT co-antagonist protein RsbR